MSNNREKRIYQETVHLYLALHREGTAKDKKCIRQVIKDEELDLKILEAKCLAMGGEWRIHRTVNARDCEKARKILLKMLIDHPEKASVIDSEWRIALMQRECRVTDYFMLDIDTQDEIKIKMIEEGIEKNNVTNENCFSGYIPIIINRIKSPKGFHYITKPFDTRKILKLSYVTFLRDGYYYVKTVGEN